LVHYPIPSANAFYLAGSRRRFSADHGLRLERLRALAGRKELSGPTAGVVQAYLELLTTAQPETFPWRLWRFYLRQASLLFGGGSRVSPVRRIRKSFVAAIGAMLWISPTSPGELHRPEIAVESLGPRRLRRTG
jgi:hypothetical protein